jgi:hypothetical protein
VRLSDGNIREAGRVRGGGGVGSGQHYLTQSMMLHTVSYPFKVLSFKPLDYLLSATSIMGFNSL